jgi:hypothetical protein
LNVTATLLIGLAAALAVLIATQSFGRIAGISTAAACGASLAFFAMEPVFSFEIASPLDQGTLLAYGLASFLLVARAPKRDLISLEPLAWPVRKPRATRRTAFAEILQTAVAHAWPEGVEIDVDPRMRVPRSPEIEPVLATVMRAGVPDLVPTRIAAYGGDTPGQSHVWLALQYKAWPAEPHVLHIGRAADRCRRLETPNGANCSVTWFDNVFERVFQISIPVTPPELNR